MKQYLTLKNILYCSLGLFVFFVLLLFLLRPQISEYVGSRISIEAAKHNVELSFEKPRIGFFSYSAEKLGGKIFRLPLFLLYELSEFKASVSPIKSLLGSLNGAVRFDCYDGSVDFNYAVDEQKVHLKKAVLDKINLAKHPQIQGFGLEKGNFSLELTDLVLEDRKKLAGEVKGGLFEISKSSNTVLHPRLTGLPIKVLVPAVRNLSLKFDTQIDERTVNIKTLESSSNFGALNLTGELMLVNRQAKIKSLLGKVELKTDGLAFLGPILPIVSNGKLEKNTKSFTFKFEKYAGRIPLFKFSA